MPTSLYQHNLTLAIGLQTNALKPIVNSRPAVDKLTTSRVVFRSAAISLLALSNEVLEKQAPSVVQLVTNTIAHFRHIGMLSYSSDALVSVLFNMLGSCVRSPIVAVVELAISSEADCLEFSLAEHVRYRGFIPYYYLKNLVHAW